MAQADISVIALFRYFVKIDIKKPVLYQHGFLKNIPGGLRGTPGIRQTEKQLRVFGCRIGNKIYGIATNHRYDLPAEELTTIYKLRWNIEIFSGWWMRRLKAYHLIARTRRGLLA